MRYLVSTLKRVTLKKELILGMRGQLVIEVITYRKNRIKRSFKNVKKTLGPISKERVLKIAQHQDINRKKN